MQGAQDLVRPLLELAALSLEAVAAVLVLGGGALALWTLVRERQVRPARDRFAHLLLLALDFTIGADLLKVAAAPNLLQVAVVGGVVLVRIALTGALLWELREEREGPAKRGPPPQERRASGN